MHPCYTKDLTSNYDEYFNKLRDVIIQYRNKVVAVGECGLDYDRLEFSTKEI